MFLSTVPVQPTGQIQASKGEDVVTSPSLWWSTMPSTVAESMPCGAWARSE